MKIKNEEIIKAFGHQSDFVNRYYEPLIVKAYRMLDEELIYALCKSAVFLHKYSGATDDAWSYDYYNISRKAMLKKNNFTCLELWAKADHAYYLARVCKIFFNYNLKSARELYIAIEFLVNNNGSFDTLFNTKKKVKDILPKDWY